MTEEKEVELEFTSHEDESNLEVLNSTYSVTGDENLFETNSDENNFYFTPEVAGNSHETSQNVVEKISEIHISPPNNDQQANAEEQKAPEDKLEEKIKVKKEPVRVEWENPEIESESDINVAPIQSSNLNTVQRVVLHPLSAKNNSVSIFLLILLVSFEVLLISAGIYMGKPNTIIFCIAIIPVQIFWIYFVYLRQRKQRESAPPQRVIETYAVAFLLESIIFVIERVAGLLFALLIVFIYQEFFNYSYFFYIEIFVMILFLSFFGQALLEESAKYLILYRNSRVIGFPTRYSIILYSIIASLSIALFTGTLGTVVIYWQYGRKYAWAAYLIEAFLTTSMQVITGMWIAINYLKHHFPSANSIPSNKSQIWIVLPSIMMHGCYSSLITSLRLLFTFHLIKWRMYVAVILLAFCLLLALMLITFAKAKKIISNPTVYQAISTV